MEATTQWGKALELLRTSKRPEDIGITLKKVIASGTISYRQLALNGIAGQSDYTRWLNGPQGPTASSLDKFLSKMGYTWHDWARAMDEVSSQQSIGCQIEQAAEYEGGYQAKKKASGKPKVPAPDRRAQNRHPSSVGLKTLKDETGLNAKLTAHPKRNKNGDTTKIR